MKRVAEEHPEAAEIFTPEDVEIIEPEPQFLWIWRAWHRLTHDRAWQTRGVSMPMGGAMITPFPCPLPWTAVHRWCEAHDYSESEALFLDHCLMAMDNVFVKLAFEQQKSKS